MNYIEKALWQKLNCLKGFNTFYINFNLIEHEIASIENIISSYRKYRISNSMPISDEENALIDEIKDRLLEISYRKNKNLLFFLAESLDNDDSEFFDFREDWDNAKTGKFSFKFREKQTYNTAIELFLLEEYKDNDIIAKYGDSHHPLVSHIIGSSLINGGYFNKGIPLILRGVLYSNNPNNPYWHSMYGLFGCTLSLWEFIRIYGLSKFKRKYNYYYMSLIKLLYLYLSRSIAISELKSAAQGYDFYRNRADFQRENYTIMMTLFAESNYLITNMDIQYMSDCQMAFLLCIKCGIPEIAQQAHHDALKIYKYGSLNNFNEENGLREIEEASFSELVERGRVRANVVAENILEQYIIGKIRIPEYIFEEMFVDIMNEMPDNAEKFKWYE